MVQVNGVSLVGVSQKLAAETLSSCAINPDTGVVQFLVARHVSRWLLHLERYTKRPPDIGVAYRVPYWQCFGSVPILFIWIRIQVFPNTDPAPEPCKKIHFFKGIKKKNFILKKYGR